MKSKEFIERLQMVTELPTMYIKGGIGRPLTDANKKKAIEQYSYNKNREKKIMAASSATFGFDCVGVIKSLLWGFCGDVTKAIGGAKYKSNGVPDVNEDGMLDLCTDVSSDMSFILPGEFLYMKGHCGIYIGENKVIECTPSFFDGVGYTRISERKWTKHGKLPSIDYNYKVIKTPLETPVLASAFPNLKRGNKGMQVSYLQQDLNYIGYKLDVDGIFGPITETMVRDFQKMVSIKVDGIYGPQTKNALYGFMKGVKKT